MTSMMEYLKEQTAVSACHAARVKLFKKIVPQLCIDNDICPACANDLIVHDDGRSPFMNPKDRLCEKCNTLFKGGKLVTYRRPDIKPKAFIQPRAVGEGT